ncbi:efflux RND transporter permease subunit [Hydrocarboniphaga sp.]|uniref:efflux RND transporter permease subunit n=1 Tax=Hydrocarboniphaga sp. TaxID=2033016 RepID=UPI003D0C436B
MNDTRREKWRAALQLLIFGRRMLVMGPLLAITALLALAMLPIKSGTSWSKTLSLDHPYLQAMQQLQPEFGGVDTLAITLTRERGDIYDEVFLSRLKAVTAAVAALPGIDASRVSSLVTPQVRYIDVVDGAFKGGSVVPADYAPTPAMLAQIRRNVARSGYIGRYVSGDQRAAMVQAEFRDGPLDAAAIAAQLDGIRKQYQGNGISLQIGGGAARSAEVLGESQRLLLFFGVTLLLVIALLCLLLGSLKLAALPLLASLVALIWQYGLLSLCGYGFDPLTLLVPLLVIAVTIAHGLQYVIAWRGEMLQPGCTPAEAALQAWRRLATGSAFGLLAALAAVASLALVPIAIVREMAVAAGFGLFGAFAASQLMLPIALSAVGVGERSAFLARQQRRDARLDGLWRLLSNIVRPRFAAVAILIAAGLCGGALWLGRGLQVGEGARGAAELRADSRYNRELHSMAAQFSSGSDVLRVIAETDPEACLKFDVMDQIDRFAWHLDNVAGVQATASLPQAARAVNAAFAESNPRYRSLPRKASSMAQATAPITPDTGLLNADCSAMAVLVWLQDQRAPTIRRVVDQLQLYNRQNAIAYYEANKDVDSKYCNTKLETRHAAMAAKTALRLKMDALRLRQPKLGDADIARDSSVAAAQAEADKLQQKLAGLSKSCPVNFVIAGGSIAAIAASNEQLQQQLQPVLLFAYAAVALVVYLAFFDIAALIAVLLPLALVSWMAYALMSAAGIGLTALTLPVAPLAIVIGIAPALWMYTAMQRALAEGARLQQACYLSLRDTGRALLIATLAIVPGLIAWRFAGLQLQRDLGLLLLFFFAANLLASLLLVPAIASFLLSEREPD